MIRHTILICCFALVELIANRVWAQNETVFTYQGLLKSNNAAANGMFDMQFSLWDSASSGNQVGPPVSQPVNVVDGQFSVELDFGAAVFDNSSRWLQIVVDGFTLDPRTRITRSPYSVQTRGIFVDGNENVGIGTSNPDALLHVQDGSAGNISAHSSSSAVFERNGTNYLSILSPDNTERGLLFGDTNSIAHGGILYDTDQAPNGMVFRTGGNTNRMRINSEGDVVVHQRMGVGNPSSLFGQLTISDSGDGAIFGLSADFNHASFPTIFASNILGPSLWAVGNSDATLAGGGVVVVGDEVAKNVAIDRNEIMARDGGAASDLFLNAEGGRVRMGLYDIKPPLAYGKIDYDGSIISASPNVLSSARLSEGSYEVTIAGNITGSDIIVASGAGVVLALELNGKLRLFTYSFVLDEQVDSQPNFVIFRH